MVRFVVWCFFLFGGYLWWNLEFLGSILDLGWLDKPWLSGLFIFGFIFFFLNICAGIGVWVMLWEDFSLGVVGGKGRGKKKTF